MKTNTDTYPLLSHYTAEDTLAPELYDVVFSQGDNETGNHRYPAYIDAVSAFGSPPTGPITQAQARAHAYKWEFAPNPAYIPTGYEAILSKHKSAGCFYWTLAPASPAPRVAFTAGSFEELEAAMQSAVSLGGVSTITVTASFDFPRTIALTQTRETVNILFSSTAGTTLGVEGFFRHFDITSTGAFILELKGLTLDGGGIGGGIDFSGAGFYLFSGTVENCLAYKGGGLYADGYTVVEAMVFRGNTTRGQSGDASSNRGGAIYLEENNELYLMAETVIEYNGSDTVRSGGGVYAGDGSTTAIRLAILQFNEAESGGGITIGDGATLNNSGYIQSNTAFFGGGGIEGEYTTEASSGTVTATSYININGHVKDNITTRTAGGIYGGTVTIGAGGFVSRNRVEGPGSEAGILCARFIMNAGIVSYNTLVTPAQYYTAGVGIKCTSALVNGGTIQGNTYINNTGFATGGGGIFCSPVLEGDTLIVTGGSILENKAHNGGGIFMFAGSNAKYATPPTMQINGEEISISRNQAATSGGGIYSYGFDIALKGATVSGNAYSNYGGGIYTIGADLLVEDATIGGNVPSGEDVGLYGGGIYANFYQEVGTPAVTILGNTLIEGNESANGGGLYYGVSNVLGAGTLTAAGPVTIRGNTADGNGGGMFLSNVSASFSGPIQIHHNSARNGGGMTLNRSQATLEGTDGTLHVTENDAAFGGGIYAYNEDTAVSLLANVAFEGNNAGQDGGAIWVDTLEKLTAAADTVHFRENLADLGYLMTDPQDIALHEQLIRTDTFTTPFRYGYNNYDIVYLNGNLLADNYTVTFDSNGGSFVPPQSVEPGGFAEEPEPPARPHYRFVGWYRDATLTLPWRFESDAVTRDITLYAAWLEEAQTYTVVYDGNGGTGGITQEVSASVYTVLSPAEASVSRPGYTFIGWNSEPDGTGATYQPGERIQLADAFTVLYAQWEAAAPAVYTVTYLPNGGTGGLTDINLSLGSFYRVRTLDEAGIAREGCCFRGWNTASDGTGIPYAPGSTIRIMGSLVLYAQWEAIVTPPPCPCPPPKPCCHCKKCCKRRFCPHRCVRPNPIRLRLCPPFFRKQ